MADREAFIQGYFERSKQHYPSLTRDADGIVFPNGRRYTAVPCDCEYEDCQGWKMVNPDEEETTAPGP